MLENQVYVFLWTVLIGAVMGLIFDFFRIMRRKGNTKDVLVYLQDIVFWLIVTVIIIVSTFLINNGELRGYMILGYILGGIFYILLLSGMIRKVLSAILDFIENIFKKMGNILTKFVKNFKFLGKKNKKIEN
ncbi:MAG: spore cortex biosynthesis protein YabQ [Clostridia bacterium]|nr:spore cortex biosynthesis protein YabQ [Clostridia bacterium]